MEVSEDVIPSHKSTVLKQAWRDGKFAHRAKGLRWDRWTAAMDDYLRRREGTMSPTQLAEVISEEFGVPRTRLGVVQRLARLGLSREPGNYTAAQVAYIFGQGNTAILQWIRDDQIKAERLNPTKSRSTWMILPRSLEDFIRTHQEMYDIQRMPKGQWRSLAETIRAKDSLLTTGEIAAILGTHNQTVVEYIKRGLIGGVPRLSKTGRTVKWFVKRSQLRVFLEKGYSSSWVEQLSTRPMLMPESCAVRTVVVAS